MQWIMIEGLFACWWCVRLPISLVLVLYANALDHGLNLPEHRRTVHYDLTCAFCLLFLKSQVLQLD